MLIPRAERPKDRSAWKLPSFKFTEFSRGQVVKLAENGVVFAANCQNFMSNHLEQMAVMEDRVSLASSLYCGQFTIIYHSYLQSLHYNYHSMGPFASENYQWTIQIFQEGYCQDPSACPSFLLFPVPLDLLSQRAAFVLLLNTLFL